jgi:fatty-acyl-CoA synthase
MSPAPLTFADALAGAAGVHDRGFTFLDAERRPTHRSYAELAAGAARLATQLIGQGLEPGQRTALLAADPHDFVRGLLALVHAGAVPVPMCPPGGLLRGQPYLRLFESLLQAAQPHAVLAPGDVLAAVRASCAAHVPRARLLALADQEAAGEASMHAAAPADTALVQLTSGSTGSPRAVVVSHANLVANALGLRREFAAADDDRDLGVSWLPLHHDMGLIGFVFAPLLHHSNMVLMAPSTFASYPRGWLEVVSEYRATVTGAPNFALEATLRHCLRPERLDLRCLRALVCGAEPIAAATVRRFLEKFQRAGLDPRAFRPAYGLAEATLAVSSGSGLRVLELDSDALEREQRARVAEAGAPTRDVVSCGRPLADHRVRIAGERGQSLEEGRVGEVRVTGPSVTGGWLGCHGEVESWGDELCTGDLGFLDAGELFLVGRRKDLIIIAGRNHAPQAIEASVESLGPRFTGRTAAFGIPGPDTEQLVVVVEVPAYDAALPRLVRERVTSELGLACKDVVLIPRGDLPRTSSGKLQRSRLRDAYLRGELARMGSAAAATEASVTQATTTPIDVASARSDV